MENLDYFADTPLDPGSFNEIHKGVWWLRMPLPWKLDHINLWILEDNEGVAIIDTGICSQTCKNIWKQTIKKLVRGRPITKIIVTHYHPDHIGGACWLTQTYNAPLYMPLVEWLYARMLSLNTGPEHMGSFAELFQYTGCPEEILNEIKGFNPIFSSFSETPPSGINRIKNGDNLKIGSRDWTVVVGEGHSPEHACLLCQTDKIFISGDIILPRITPHIGVYPDQPDANPLKDYYDTLNKFKELPGDLSILPSHNEPFFGLHERITQLKQHHDKRLEKTFNACSNGATAWEVMQKLFRIELGAQNTVFAMPEALAHLNLLICDKSLIREQNSEGIWSYHSN